MPASDQEPDVPARKGHVPGSDHDAAASSDRRGPNPSGAVVLRSYQLIGRPARDLAGRPLGRVLDLVIDGDPQVPARVTAVLVSTGPWGRLLGYESPDEHGPWLLAALARWVIRRHIRVLDWDEVRIEPPD
jgi:hypothetical protein